MSYFARLLLSPATPAFHLLAARLPGLAAKGNASSVQCAQREQLAAVLRLCTAAICRQQPRMPASDHTPAVETSAAMGAIKGTMVGEKGTCGVFAAAR